MKITLFAIKLSQNYKFEMLTSLLRSIDTHTASSREFIRGHRDLHCVVVAPAASGSRGQRLWESAGFRGKAVKPRRWRRETADLCVVEANASDRRPSLRRFSSTFFTLP